MSDDLVKRLRDRGVCSLEHNSCRNDMVCDQAADRIEELEAKLTKAAEALAELNTVAKRAIRLSQEHDSFRLYGMEPMWQATAQATTTLAELTGGKGE